MKSFIAAVNKVSQKMEWKQETSNSGIMTLVKREGIDLSKISEKDFVSWIYDDYKAAVKEYAVVCKKINDEDYQAGVRGTTNRAKEYAETKWKTQAKRDEYVKKELENYDKKYYPREDPEKITFDLNVKYRANSIPQDFIISRYTTKETLKKVYHELFADETYLNNSISYFHKGHGWAFRYIAESEDSRKQSRPYIEILLSEEEDKERKQIEKSFGQSVEDFYRNTNYWGD